MGRRSVKCIPIPVVNFRKPVMDGTKFLFGLTLHVNDRTVCLDMADTPLKHVQLHPFNVNLDGLDGLRKLNAVQWNYLDPARPYLDTLSTNVFGEDFGKVPHSFHFA